MKTAYFDTNVFISSYKPDDIYHRECSTIVEALKQSEIIGETSTLTILEMVAVTSRAVQTGKRDDAKIVRRRAVGRALLSLSRLRLKFIQLSGDISAHIGGVRVEMPTIFHQAMLLAPEVGLKSFDLVHLAAARYSKLAGSKLDAFVTGDSAFLNQKRKLFALLDVPFLSPKEFIRAAGLKKNNQEKRDKRPPL